MTIVLNPADVPEVSAAELYEPMRRLIARGEGLALLKGMSEADLRRLEDELWAELDMAAETRLAVALRFRALVALFGARRLKELLLHRGFKLVGAAVAEAAAQRLNMRFGFNIQKFVVALDAATATSHAAPALPRPTFTYAEAA